MNKINDHRSVDQSTLSVYGGKYGPCLKGTMELKEMELGHLRTNQVKSQGKTLLRKRREKYAARVRNRLNHNRKRNMKDKRRSI
jgi:ribosomal protein S30